MSIRLGRSFFCVFTSHVFALHLEIIWPFQLGILWYYHGIRYTTKEWSKIAYYFTTNWLTSHKTTRGTTRAGVNLYLQNRMISCRLKKMLIPSAHTSIFTSHISHSFLKQYSLIPYRLSPFPPRCAIGALFGQILYLHFRKLNFDHFKCPIFLITMFGMYLQIFSEWNSVEVEIFSNNR